MNLSKFIEEFKWESDGFVELLGKVDKT